MSKNNASSSTRSSRVLFQLTGSIACFKACAAISKLVQRGHEVEVVATKGALSFIGAATFEGLTSRRVHEDTFAPGDSMSHIHLAKWADVSVLCPATANTLSKLAHGIGDDLVSTLFLAHDFSKPYLVMPAMNVAMWNHPATKTSVSRLKEWGVRFCDPSSGNLACGDVGAGRLIEPDEIVAAIESALAENPNRTSVDHMSIGRGHDREMVPLEVLVTAGGTREPIDGVRAITNTSTGRTAARIADEFVQAGARVTYVHGISALKPSLPCAKMQIFDTFDDLDRVLRTELGSRKFDVVIHAAAVSDFRLASIESDGRAIEKSKSSKIDSDETLTLKLERNPKILDHLREYSSNPKIRVVAFKLTNTPDAKERMAAVEKLALRSRPDWIVHNDLSEIAGDRHLGAVFRATSSTSPKAQTTSLQARVENKESLAKVLVSLVQESCT